MKVKFDEEKMHPEIDKIAQGQNPGSTLGRSQLPTAIYPHRA